MRDDRIPVYLTCPQTKKGKIVAGYCMTNCKFFKGIETWPRDLFIHCGWEESNLEEEERKREEEYSRRLEEIGNRRIGAVAMDTRLKQKARRDDDGAPWKNGEWRWPGKKSRFKVPSPGSDEAISQGCECPQMDNHYGTGIYGDNSLFWINQKCPLHGEATKKPLG